MPRMKNTARADGRVQSRVYISTGTDGKKKYKYVYADTNAELQRKIIDAKTKLGKGIDLMAENDTFGYWRRNWLKIKKTEASAKWYESCEIYAGKLADLENVKVSKLRAMDLQSLLIDMSLEKNQSGKFYSERTLKITRDIAREILDMAVDNRVIEYNPFSRVKLPKAQREPEKRQALTTAQQEWIYNTPHRAQLPAMIMMCAGLRRGELLALTWRDIDIEAKTITINKAVEMKSGKPGVKNCGKTDAAMRTVYIPDRLADFLREQPQTTFLVCPAASGNLMTETAWRKLWESYLAELNVRYGDFEHNLEYQKRYHEKHPDVDVTILHRPGTRFDPENIPFMIPRITAHWLRHTFITNMYLAGVDVLTAKQQAGHSDIKVTMDIYTHLDSEHQNRSMEKLNDYLARGVKGGVRLVKKNNNPFLREWHYQNFT